MREVERKYRASRGLVLPDLTGRIPSVSSIDPPVTHRMVAVYHDTADLRLAREGITLRHRTGGSDDGWHLKLPLGPLASGVREEIQVAADGAQPPEELRQAVTAYVRFADVVPAATLVTERQSRILRDDAGAPLAEIVDDQVTVQGVGRVSAGFREIEVEDCGGGTGVLSAVGAVLEEAGAVGGEFMPKLVRSLGARATAPPDPPLPEPVTVNDPAGRVLAGYLRMNVRRLLAEDVRFRLSGEDAVHQLRVAARRMRTALKVFAPLVDEEWATLLQEELRWLAGTLSTSRDAEVLLARLLADVDTLRPEFVLGPAKARLQQFVGGELATGMELAEQTLADERYLGLLERLVDAAWSPRLTDLANGRAGVVLPDLVRRAWRKLGVGVARVRETHDTGDYHRVRIAAKRARYAAEAVAPAFGKPAERFARQVVRIQDVLGEHQDAVTAQDTLRRLAQSPAGKTVGFTCGMLHALEERKAATARAEFEASRPEVARRRYRGWLAT
ncbi:MAG: CHAD domain-containing protein [Actinomycetes bacterium]